jgi:hypothetical protein
VSSREFHPYKGEFYISDGQVVLGKAPASNRICVDTLLDDDIPAKQPVKKAKVGSVVGFQADVPATQPDTVLDDAVPATQPDTLLDDAVPATQPDTLLGKRPRVGAGGAAPPWVISEPDLDAALVGLSAPTPDGQQQVAKRLTTYTVQDWPIVDHDRVMPANFDGEHRAVFIRLPEAALPRGDVTMSRGRHNFTVTGANGAAVQVQLQNKLFRALAWPGGGRFQVKHEDGTSTKPNVTFATHSTVQGAWQVMLEKLGATHLDD